MNHSVHGEGKTSRVKIEKRFTEGDHHSDHTTMWQPIIYGQLTSFFKVMLNLVILAHHVRVSNVNSIVLLDLPVG